MHSRRVAAVLVWIAVNSEVEEVSADAAVVEQSIAFAGGAISANLGALLLALNQEGQELALGAMNLCREPRIVLDVLKSDLRVRAPADAPTLGDVACAASARQR